MPESSHPQRGQRRLWVESALLAALVILPWAILELPRGLGLSDEGSLWFLSYELAEHGSLPVRDHRFYDPGRYFLLTPFVWVFGEGVVAIRLGGLVYLWIGLSMALRAISQAVESRGLRVVLAAVLSLWIFPLHKLVDHAVLLAAVYVFVQVVRRPTRSSSLLAGVFVGAAAFVGRNHGLYLAVAFGGIEMALWMGRRGGQVAVLSERLGAFVVGIVLGLLPLWGLMLLKSGFAAEYIDFVRQSTVALGKPVPWPWAVAYSRHDWLLSAFNLTLGSLFLWLAAFPLLGGWRLWKRCAISNPGDVLLLVCTGLGLGYLPQAFGRPDVSHLAQAIHPAVIGVVPLVALFSRRRVFAAVLLTAIALSAGVASVYKRAALQEWRDPTPWATVEVAGDRLRLTGNTIGYLDRVRGTLASSFPQPPESSGRVYLGPYRAGLYRVLRWESPCWDSGWPHAVGERQQRRMIQQLKDADLLGALVWMHAVDGREELRFDRTHPLVWDYLRGDFDMQELAELPEHLLFTR